MKKFFQIFKTIFVCLVALAAVFIMGFTITSVSVFDRVDRDIFGYKAFVVLSDSMSATDFKAGDLILTKPVEAAALKEGDIIAYQSTHPENYGEVVTHKIRALTKDAEGNPGFITYGTTTGRDDENIVPYSLVLGKYQTSLPGVGSFFQFLKTTPGYIVCIFLPFLLLILMQGVNSFRLFKRYKKEQLAEIEAQRKREQLELAAERERLEEERLESRRMMTELLLLKTELSGRGGAAESGSEDEKIIPQPK